MSTEFYAGPGITCWNVTSDHEPSALEFYRQSIRDLYQVSDIDPVSTFFTNNTVYRFGPYVLGRGKSVGQVLVRGPDEIRRSGLDNVAIMLALSEIKGDADGTDVNAPARTIHLRDLARPYALKVESVDTVTVAMPRDRAPRWLIERNLHGSFIDGTPQISRLLTGHLVALLERAPLLSVDEGVAGIEVALVMGQKAFTREGRFTADQAQAAYRGLRQSAVALIDRVLHDPELKIQMLTQRLGVSRATLFRAFALSGGVNLYIKQRRLELARAALLARVGRLPTVGEIAHAHGFATESHFSRSFRDRYGHPPGAVEPADPERLNPGCQAEIRYDLLLNWMKGDDQPIRAAS